MLEHALLVFKSYLQMFLHEMGAWAGDFIAGSPGLSYNVERYIAIRMHTFEFFRHDL